MQKLAPSESGQAGAEIDVTPAMIAAFNDWIVEWDVIENGYPGGRAVRELIVLILACTRSQIPES